MPERVDLDAATAAINRAHTEVGEIAKEGPARRWRMSIPAQPDRDSDLLIANGLGAGRLVVAELRDARVALDQYREYASRLEVQLAEAERIIARFTEQRLTDATERDRASGKVP